MKKCIAIIGAGVSGLTAARVLRSKGFEPVVFEKYNQPGGLIRCSLEEGNLFHLVGGIVFNTRNEQVKTWFNRQFDVENEFYSTTRNAKIWTGGRLIGYPIENFLYQLPGNLYFRIIRELFKIYWNSGKSMNFDEFLRKNFGPTLYEIYFHPYNSKIWNFELDRIPLPWLNGKLPMPDIPEILISNFLKKPEKKMVHSSFFYPKNEGSMFIANRLAEGSEIIFNTEVNNIERSGNQWKINDQHFDIVIYTGDVRRLEKILLNIPLQASGYLNTIKSLPSNSTSNVLCYTDETDLSWMYIPDKKFRCHRIVYTGNMSPGNNSGQRKTCVVEFSGKMEGSIMREQLKLLPGNLQPIAYSYEPDSYVIQLHDTRDNIAGLKAHLNPLNFHLVGRFAEWEYHNMDMAMLSAMKVCDIV